MPTEYYDRGLPASRLLPASRPMQDEYWRLRSELCKAIAKNMRDVAAASPEIAGAVTALEVYVASHPTRTFSVFRPEDVRLTQEAGSPAFLR